MFTDDSIYDDDSSSGSLSHRRRRLVSADGFLGKESGHSLSYESKSASGRAGLTVPGRRTDKTFPLGENLPFINPSRPLDTLQVLVQELIGAQQEQYQHEIRQIRDEIRALDQLLNRHRSGQSNRVDTTVPSNDPSPPADLTSAAPHSSLFSDSSPSLDKATETCNTEVNTERSSAEVMRSDPKHTDWDGSRTSSPLSPQVVHFRLAP